MIKDREIDVLEDQVRTLEDQVLSKQHKYKILYQESCVKS
jgi:hypothetical protein